MVHDMHLMQVKTPAESKAPWDYEKRVQTLAGEKIYGPLSESTCKFVKK
jgi:branched-chain amino acid transport system substrate-binding protein